MLTLAIARVLSRALDHVSMAPDARPRQFYRCIAVNLRTIAGLTALLFAATVGWRGAHFTPATAAPARAVDQVWRGAASCAAVACHGGPEGGVKGSELTTWATADPHARAFAVLHEPRSRAIVKNYYGLADIHDAHPTKTALCLRCHVTPNAAQVPERFHADGVSCESCHGGSGAWLTQHYRPTWKALTTAEKAATGFRATKDLPTRATACVACHVGAPGMEVDHDLLAAGHPRLNFEFASYQAILPHHWRRPDDVKRYPDFEARSWAMGQAMCAAAALDALASRAQRPDSPWPDFADNDCYRCHQAITARPSGQTNSQKPGLLRMNDWYYAELPTVLALGGKPADVNADLAALRSELARNRPRRDIVGPAANRLATQVRDWLAQPLPAFSTVRVRMLLDDRAATLKADADGDWDRAAQDYLAAAALYQTLGDLVPRFADPALHATLQRRRQELAFPPGTRSPGPRRALP